MTTTERNEALQNKEFWETLENTWRGNNVDFVVKAVVAGRDNEWIFRQLEFPQQTCPGFKDACFKAFDYCRATHVEVIA